MGPLLTNSHMLLGALTYKTNTMAIDNYLPRYTYLRFHLITRVPKNLNLRYSKKSRIPRIRRHASTLGFAGCRFLSDLIQLHKVCRNDPVMADTTRNDHKTLPRPRLNQSFSSALQDGFYTSLSSVGCGESSILQLLPSFQGDTYHPSSSHTGCTVISCRWPER